MAEERQKCGEGRLHEGKPVDDEVCGKTGYFCAMSGRGIQSYGIPPMKTYAKLYFPVSTSTRSPIARGRHG
jgi:hypothetical protein